MSLPTNKSSNMRQICANMRQICAVYGDGRIRTDALGTDAFDRRIDGRIRLMSRLEWHSKFKIKMNLSCSIPISCAWFRIMSPHLTLLRTSPHYSLNDARSYGMRQPSEIMGPDPRSWIQGVSMIISDACRLFGWNFRETRCPRMP